MFFCTNEHLPQICILILFLSYVSSIVLFTLIDIINCLTNAMSNQGSEKSGNNVLVVDEFALSVLNAAVSQNELLKAGFIST